MKSVEIFFWISLGLIFYTYIGYGIIMFIAGKLKKNQTYQEVNDQELPEVTHIIAAYNEESIIEEKIQNCLMMDYPAAKMNTVIVTDGSTDRTMDIVSDYPQVNLMHSDKRAGKLAAVNRAISATKSPIIIFSDANAMINREAFRNMAKHFQYENVGAVAGEKVVISEDSDDAAAAGEGFYWKYESWLKKQDYKLHSVVGAAGELFAVRRALYQSPNSNMLIEDFITSMSIAAKGYRVAYEPNAQAKETASASISEEIKRKVRISAGGLQAVASLIGNKGLMRNKTLFFQYLSHRVFRWTVAPISLLILLLLNVPLAFSGSVFYQILLFGQLAFYLVASAGYWFEKRKMRFKAFFVPFYFTFMNLSVYLGAYQLLFGNLSVTWNKAARK